MYLAPALQLSTVQERESFEFFTTYAVSSLRGFLDSPFWQREVLQAAHRISAIQHCVVALGAMHRRFHDGHSSNISEADMASERLQFALRQSNKAIQDLMKKQSSTGQMAGADRVTLMTCSILFSSMCCLQGHQRDASDHLRSGIRMLNEMDEQDQEAVENHPIAVDSLRTLLVGLDLQARSIRPSAEAKNWVARPKANVSTTVPDAELNMPSLLMLLRYFESLLNHINAFFQATVYRTVSEIHDVHMEYLGLIKRFQRGASVLKTLHKKDKASGNYFSQSVTALQLLEGQVEYLLRSPRPDVETKFNFAGQLNHRNAPFNGPFDPATLFKIMLELAARLLQASAGTSPVFTTTTGPLSALWLIAMRAPSSCTQLRRRAVKLMLSHPRREGFWDGMVAGNVAQELLNLEQESIHAELGLAAIPGYDLVVPDDLRILAVTITYEEDNNRKARVGFSTSADLATGKPSRVRWINW